MLFTTFRQVLTIIHLIFLLPQFLSPPHSETPIIHILESYIDLRSLGSVTAPFFVFYLNHYSLEEIISTPLYSS